MILAKARCNDLNRREKDSLPEGAGLIPVPREKGEMPVRRKEGEPDSLFLSHLSELYFSSVESRDVMRCDALPARGGPNSPKRRRRFYRSICRLVLLLHSCQLTRPISFSSQTLSFSHSLFLSLPDLTSRPISSSFLPSFISLP